MRVDRVVLASVFAAGCGLSRTGVLASSTVGIQSHGICIHCRRSRPTTSNGPGRAVMRKLQDLAKLRARDLVSVVLVLYIFGRVVISLFCTCTSDGRLKHVSIPRRRHTTGGTVCIVARTHAGEKESTVEAFLYSVKAQSFQDFHLWLVNSEAPGLPVFENHVARLQDDRFVSKTFGEDKKSLPSHSYGYITSSLALTEIVRSPASAARGYQFVLFTNADNLYQHEFLERTVQAFADKEPPPCIVATDFVSRYRMHYRNGVALGYGEPNNVRKAEFVRNQIDLGAAVVSVASIRDAFGDTDEFFELNDTQADYVFFDRVLSKVSGDTSCGVTISQVLFVHQ